MSGHVFFLWMAISNSLLILSVPPFHKTYNYLFYLIEKQLLLP